MEEKMINSFIILLTKATSINQLKPPPSKWLVLLGSPQPPLVAFLCMALYGKNKFNFWDSLSSVGKNFDVPWLCLGDFNVILDQSEKLGGRPFSNSSNDVFRSFMDQLGMIDLGFTGNPFTWSDNRQGKHLIKERLDRGLSSSQWIHLFPTFSLASYSCSCLRPQPHPIKHLQLCSLPP
jgi:hypothetical protein